ENLREFRGPQGEIAMRLEFQGADRQTVAQLSQLPLVNRDGERIVLATVADLELVAGPRNIFREDRRTGIGITMNLDEVTPEVARERITEVMNQVALPPGYDWTYGQGGFGGDSEAMTAMAFNMLLALALIFIVM